MVWVEKEKEETVDGHMDMVSSGCLVVENEGNRASCLSRTLGFEATWLRGHLASGWWRTREPERTFRLAYIRLARPGPIRPDRPEPPAAWCV